MPHSRPSNVFIILIKKGINKIMFYYHNLVAYIYGRLKWQIFRKMQRLVVKLQRVNSLFSAKRLNWVTGTFSNYRPLFRIFQSTNSKLLACDSKLKIHNYPLPSGSFCYQNFINLLTAGTESWKLRVGFAHKRKSRVTAVHRFDWIWSEQI